NGIGIVDFEAFSSTITGNLSIVNGEGPDIFKAGGLSFTVTGAVTIANGDGGSATNFGSFNKTSIGGALTMINGAGADTFSIGSDTVELHSVIIKNGNQDSSISFAGGNQTITG